MLRVNLVVILLAVICVVHALQHSSTSGDGVNQPSFPFSTSSQVFVTQDKTDFIDSSQRQMQIAHFQSKGFLDDANDAIDDAESAFKNVQLYVKKAGTFFLNKKIDYIVISFEKLCSK